jgi:hypothetical protein
MTDPSRLIEHEADELERDMLLAGRRDGPSSARRRAITAGLGVGMASTLTVASAAKAAAAGAAKASVPHGVSWLSQLVRAPWAVGGALGAAAIAAGVSLWPAAPSSPTTVSSTLTAPLAKPAPPRPPAPPAPPAPRVDEPAPTKPRPAQFQAPSLAASRGPAPPDAAPAAAPSLADELALLETARAALVRGEPRRTLSVLDEHARNFRRPRLTTEASVLRIEALVASGDRARAARLGKDFLAKHANGPYERRVRSLIGDQRSASANTF